MDTHTFQRARNDLARIVTDAYVWNALAWAQMRSRYRHSTLGTLWITATTGSLAVAIGLVYGQFFGVEIREYLPYFVASYITWILISSVFNEASTIFVSSGNLIKTSQMPIVFYAMKMIQNHILIFAHNLIVLLLLWPLVGWEISWFLLLSIPGFLINYVFLIGCAMFIGVICVRYRDLPPLVQVVSQFLFFVTPIIWLPEQLRFGQIVLIANPIAYMIEVVRDPLLGRPLDPLHWLVAAGFAVATLTAGAFVYIRYRHRIAYWV